MKTKKKPKLSDAELQQKAEDLGHSRPLYAWRVSDHPEVKDVIGVLFAEMDRQGLVSKRYGDKLRRNLSTIVLDLYVASDTDPKLYISYSRNGNDYGKGKSLFFLTHSHVIKSVDFLIGNQYVENILGFRNPQNPSRSKLSRMRATEKLIDLFRQKKIVLGMIKRDEDEPLLILRDDEKQPVDFEETEDTKRMTENLKIINKALSKWAILLYVTDDKLKQINERMRENPDPGKRGPIDFTNKRLRRIFNNSRWNQGGRFFGGWWQNVPREYRKYIRLDDKHVVECDYSGLHINMLYALEKRPMPKGDVYHLDGYSNDEIFRKFVKQLLLVMVNAESRDKARGAINEAVYRYKELELPPEITSTKGEHLFPVMDAFASKHHKISHYFCSGKGIDLQNLDSKIAEKVLMSFAKFYAVLPLHDSFVVHHGLEDTLKESMQQAFLEVLGCETKIDLKYNSLEERRKEFPPKPGHYKVDFAEVRAAKVPFSTYHNLLTEHYRSRSPNKKAPEQESDFIPF